MHSPAGTPLAIARAALLVGTLDASAAVLNYLATGGKAPVKIFLYIASAALGKEALTGGWSMAALGLLFHYLIAATWTVFFFLIYPHVRVLAKNAAATGLACGLFVWTVMNLAVVPLSHIGRFPSDPSKAAVQAAILVVCIGLPLSFLARRHYAPSRG